MSRRPVTSSAPARRRRGDRRHSPSEVKGSTATSEAPRAARGRQGPEQVVSAARRRRRRVIKATALAVAVVVSLVAGGQWILHQSIFRVQHAVVSGEVHESAQQILATTHLDAHPALIDLSQASVARELSIYPWIGSVSLIKRWPNTVDLAVHEVAAVAVAYDPHHVLEYVSAAGRALGVAAPSANLPTLATSPAALAAKAWTYTGAESAAALVASELPVAFASQVREVIADAQGNVTLQLTTPLRFFLGPDSNLTAKFVAVASAIAHGTFVAGDTVDVTTPSELSVTGPSPS